MPTFRTSAARKGLRRATATTLTPLGPLPPPAAAFAAAAAPSNWEALRKYDDVLSHIYTHSRAATGNLRPGANCFAFYKAPCHHVFRHLLLINLFRQIILCAAEKNFLVCADFASKFSPLHATRLFTLSACLLSIVFAELWGGTKKFVRPCLLAVGEGECYGLASFLLLPWIASNSCEGFLIALK